MNKCLRKFQTLARQESCRPGNRAQCLRLPGPLRLCDPDRHRPCHAQRHHVQQRPHRKRHLIARQRDRAELPSLGKMILEQTAAADAPPADDLVRTVDEFIEENYRTTLY